MTYLVTATDGAWARLSGWNAVQDMPPDLSLWATSPHCFGVLLIRRGGYAIGISRGKELVQHKCGTRYVQSRTAAGGWSQQRFARRRSNQADELVSVTVQKSAAIFADEKLGALVVGGDKALVAQVLSKPALKPLKAVRTREFYDIPDPRLVVLRNVAKRALSVRITVSNGPTSH